MKMSLGAQLYTVRDYTKNEADYRMMMKKIAEIGYKTVQMSGFNTEAITPAIIKEVTEENNLKVVLTHTAWDRIKNETEQVIEEHNLFNCDAIGIGGYHGDRSYDGFMRFCDSGLFGYKDHRGEDIIDAKYLWAGDFCENRAVVETELGFGVINSRNEFVVKPYLESLYYDTYNSIFYYYDHNIVCAFDYNGTPLDPKDERLTHLHHNQGGGIL